MWDSRCSSSLPVNSTPTVVVLGAAVAVQQSLGILFLSSFLSCHCLTPSLSQHRLLSLLCNGLIFLLPQLASNCSFYLNCIFVILRYYRKCHPSVSPKNGIVSPLFTAFLSPSKASIHVGNNALRDVTRRFFAKWCEKCTKWRNVK